MSAVISRRRRRIRRAGWHLAMIIVSLVVLLPIIVMVLASFKSAGEFVTSPYSLPKHFDLSNYSTAWNQADVVVTLRNSLIVTLSAVILSTVLAALASYGLARFRFPFRGIVRGLFTAGIVVPVQLIMLPFFVLMRQTHLLGSSLALIVAYTVFNIPLGVLVMTPFFRVLPRELEEAAWIDGAGHLRSMLAIMLPLMRPAIATVVILNGIWIWNDFSIALVIATKSSIDTLPVGIMAFYGSFSTAWGPIFASVTIATLPIVIGYLLLSKQFVAGLTSGAVKG